MKSISKAYYSQRLTKARRIVNIFAKFLLFLVTYYTQIFICYKLFPIKHSNIFYFPQEYDFSFFNSLTIFPFPIISISISSFNKVILHKAKNNPHFLFIKICFTKKSLHQRLSLKKYLPVAYILCFFR